jgi:hypothetical protein
MLGKFKPGWMMVLLVIALLVAFGGAGAVAAQADDVIYGAMKKNNGQLRIIDSPDDLLKSEELISWNRIGPQGPQGPSGTGYLFPNHPTVVSIHRKNVSSIPAGWKLTGTYVPCLDYERTTYWPFSCTDNHFGLLLVGFDRTGSIVQQVSDGGNRYWSSASVNTAARTVTFVGQSGSATLSCKND